MASHSRRGPALVDVSYDEFAAAEAARLDELRLDCLEARLAGLLAVGENDDALAEAARLSAEHPLVSGYAVST